MIENVGLFSNPKIRENKAENLSSATGSNVVAFRGSTAATPAVPADKFALALKALSSVNLASSVSFGSGNIFSALVESSQMHSCKDPSLGEAGKGEEVGQHININNIIASLKEQFEHKDAKGKDYPAVKIDKAYGGTEYRTQLKKLEDNTFFYSMIELNPSRTNQYDGHDDESPRISAKLNPEIKDTVAFLENKGKMTPIIRGKEANADVLLLVDGMVKRKEKGKDDAFDIILTKRIPKDVIKETKEQSSSKLKEMAKMQVTRPNVAEILLKMEGLDFRNEAKKHLVTSFVPYGDNIQVPEVKKVKHAKLEGFKNAQVVIGLQEGRFCKEIIQSLIDFKKKIELGNKEDVSRSKNKEASRSESEGITLPKFTPLKENQNNMRFLILAGGFGSRAEYTNASSDAIFHSEKIKDSPLELSDNGKGSFRTATGLTPIESTLMTLHQAGLFDLSNFEIGKDVVFYMNAASEENRGNGGFTLDMYKELNKQKGKVEGQYQFVLSSDALSRLPETTKEIKKIMEKGESSVTMTAKEYPTEVARGNFGIMKMDESGQIISFAEKPKDDATLNAFKTPNEKVLVNAFQFAVTHEALDALDLLIPKFKLPEVKKDALDWSMHLIPSLMAISKCDTKEQMVAAMPVIMSKMCNPHDIIRGKLENVKEEYKIDLEKGITIIHMEKTYKKDSQGKIVNGADGKPIVIGKKPVTIFDESDTKNTYTVEFEGKKYMVYKPSGLVLDTETNFVSLAADFSNFTSGLLVDDKNGKGDDVFKAAKEIIGKQKVRAISTGKEFWFDVGQLKDLYDATTDIVQDTKGVYGFTPWERKNAIEATNPNTGLIASSKEQKEKIEKDYVIAGRVYATPKATYVPNDVLYENKSHIVQRGKCVTLVQKRK